MSAINSAGSPQKMMAASLVNNPAAPTDPRPIGRGVHTAAVFMVVAARSLPSLDEAQKRSLRRLTDEIIEKQRPDGSWEFFLSRPPINENQATDTAWIIMALQNQARVDPSKPLEASLKKGIAWLQRADLAGCSQARVLKLLVSLRAGEPRSAIQSDIDEVLAQQRRDGGWSQTAQLPSDAFATGQILYVLSLAGYTAEMPPIQRHSFPARHAKP